MSRGQDHGWLGAAFDSQSLDGGDGLILQPQPPPPQCVRQCDAVWPWRVVQFAQAIFRLSDPG
jgi:hypothetical protein